jgi:C_GCAxxG_C_C family probable redox protein
MGREETLKKTKDALDSFDSGFSCAQAVLTAYARDMGLPPDITNRLASPFAGGIARRSLTCGAVSGALMVIGLKFGRDRADDNEAKELTFAKVNEFCSRFIDKNGSINCGELLGCDLATEEGRKYFRENRLSKMKCREFVRAACEILESGILADKE